MCIPVSFKGEVYGYYLHYTRSEMALRRTIRKYVEQTVSPNPGITMLSP